MSTFPMNLSFANVFTIILCVAATVRATDESAAVEQCKEDFQKVVTCLDFARGQDAVPTKECCGSVSIIKNTHPKCLCYIIAETHKGGEAIKNLGIQEAKLLQLPSACHLKNASTSYCPKLLGLSPNSPDSAIFISGSNLTSPTTLTTSPSPPSLPHLTNGSGTTVSGNGPKSIASAAVIVATTLLYMSFAFLLV